MPDLIPAIVQDVDTRRVLMMAWMDAEARRLTQQTGDVHFWSRSRKGLWRKGETSGNVLRFVEMREDCDSDTLLVLARPVGPACHTGADTCWDQTNDTGFSRLEKLWSVIEDRREQLPEGSYTTRLFREGPQLPARKVIEEAGEVAEAAVAHATGGADDARLAEEVSDLLYHLLVLVAERNLDPRAVFEVLEDRAGRAHRPGSEGAPRE